MLKWDRRHDTFEPGQWFKGQVELGLSDLSPDGKYLIYFALKYRGPHRSWTAISKPPWFTALAFLPILAIHGGGGEFIENRRLWINHPRGEAPIITEKLRPLEVAGYFEDRPPTAQGRRLLSRNGWSIVPRRRFLSAQQEEVEWGMRHVETWRKPNPHTRMVLEMEANWRSGGFGKGPWSYHLLSDNMSVFTHIEADWADWDSDGSLLFAQQGRLFRSVLRRERLTDPKELIDVSRNRFEEKVPPVGAIRW
jgi:hypothetical protein